jgi:hypothetical protein
MTTGRPLRNSAGDTIGISERATHRSAVRLDISSSDPWNAAVEQLKLLRALSPQERRATFSVLRKLLAVYGAGIPSLVTVSEDEPS